MAIDGAPRRRSDDRRLDVPLTPVSQPFLTKLIKFWAKSLLSSCA
jgi:hypothetical protein